jgi:hypothetical protein
MKIVVLAILLVLSFGKSLKLKHSADEIDLKNGPVVTSQVTRNY